MKTDEKLAGMIRVQMQEMGRSQQSVGVRISGSERTFKRRLQRPSKMPLDELGRLFIVLNFDKTQRQEFTEALYRAQLEEREK